MIPLQVGYAAITYYMLVNQAAAPFLDLDWMRMIFAVQAAIAFPGSIVLLVLGLVARKRWPDSRLLAHLAMQCVAVSVAFGSYSFGHSTDVFGPMAVFAVTVMGLFLFEASIVRAGLLSLAAMVVATTVAEQMRLIPYAPSFARPPYADGYLARSVLLPHGFAFLILLGVAFFFVAVMQRLRRATDLIRRYVPVQLAEKILAGEHTGTAQPERRKVTLFFSDVVGFTNTADQMEPEDLSSMLNEYLSEMTVVADRFGATVNQIVGDGIMAFFGAPEATNDRDHALRAVCMALAMQGRMGELREKWFATGIQTPFQIRIGINTGVASVGDFGSEGRTTYSAIGNQTNLTARIQAHCQPGKVLISHTTWALVNDEVPCQERGEIEVKGLHYPVRVYEVVEEGSGDA